MLKHSLALFALASLFVAGCAPFPAESEAGVARRSVKTPHGTVRLAVQEMGAGAPLLLLHGLGTSSFTWRHMMPELARTHRVIAVDLRGFGMSDKPLDDRYAIQDQAEVLEAFIRQENLRNVTVAGHSFGGGVALALAVKLQREAPGRLRSLVLIDTIAYRQPVPIFFQILQAPVLADIGLALVPPEVQAEQALKIAFYDKSKVTPEAVREYAAPLESAEGKHALRATVSRIVPEDIDEFTAKYKTLDLPVKLIWCAEDRIVPLEFGKRLDQELPRSELTVLSGCGHMPQEEKPAETLQAMKGFLAKQAARRS
jgi:pimeloyl-ACP methyl ester carboxylesterase